MVWKTTNALGQEVTWYSEEDVKQLKKELEEAKLFKGLYETFYRAKHNDVTNAIATFYVAKREFEQTIAQIKELSIRSIGCDNPSKLRAMFSEVLHRISEVEHGNF